MHPLNEPARWNQAASILSSAKDASQSDEDSGKANLDEMIDELQIWLFLYRQIFSLIDCY